MLPVIITCWPAETDDPELTSASEPCRYQETVPPPWLMATDRPLVDQDVFLFDDSVMDNVRYARPSASDEEGATNTQAPQKSEQSTVPAQKQPQGKRFRRTDAPQAPQKADSLNRSDKVS